MKSIIAALLVTFSASAFAYSYSAFDDVEESKCPGLKEVKTGLALCTKVKGVREIIAASTKNSYEINSLPAQVEFYNVVELDIWPDDSTSMMYWFLSVLRDEKGKEIGYRVFHAYHNTEMEDTIKLETRYNLNGKLVSIEIH